MSTAEMQITVRETRADLRVRDIWISPEDRRRGYGDRDRAVYNGGYKVPMTFPGKFLCGL